ncbi:MAG: TrmH family RNA methyltransferase, partial [Candidatus Kryptoniota bacterium]
MKSERRIGRISRALLHTQPDLKIALENIHDPHNVSAILRTCDAIGVRQIDLIYTEEKFPKIGRKSSASANKWIRRTNFKSVKACYESLKEDGFIIVASVVDEES